MPNPTYNKQSPIGLFDSGVGGLSIYQHLYQQLPNENYLYFADTLNVPYGGREHSEIVELTLHAVEWLYNQGCKLIVIACNSASAHALEIARAKFANVPIVGLVPALKPAILASKSKHVAVLATQATLNGSLLHEVIETIAKPNQVKISKHFEPALVPWVELGMPENCTTASNLQQIIDDFYQQNIDHLVLGCTHYPFFRPFVENYIEQNQLSITLVDSGLAIALRVKQLLAENDLFFNDKTSDKLGELQFYASQSDEQLQVVIKRLLPNMLNISINNNSQTKQAR